jgi:cell division protein FtsB
MPKDTKVNRQDDLATRTDQLLRTIERLESEIKVLQATGLVAPPGCWIVRYLAKGKRGEYWYYKLQANEAIFPMKIKGKYTKYKHLGKAGSNAYLIAVEQVATRAKIEGLQRAIDTLLQGSADLIEEAEKYKQD